MLYLFPHYFKTKLKIIEAGKVNKKEVIVGDWYLYLLLLFCEIVNFE